MDQPNAFDTSDSSEVVEQAIAGYLEALSQGRPLDRDAWLTAHPDCAAELRQFLQDHDRIMQAAGPWRSTAELDCDGPLTTDDTPMNRELGTINFEVIADRLKPSSVTDEKVSSEIVRFGDYELLQQIGRGGMGVVYKAHQKSLNRIVALKMIGEGRFAAAEDLQRFHLEAQAAAKLEHPHMVTIYEVGSCGNQHYFSMEYIDGQNLAELTRDGPLRPRQAAQYVQHVAEAVHFAHEHGVLHRDIKPSNVLIDATGSVRVMDFGLAKYVERSQKLTVTGQILGTLAYMAPEQITSRSGELGPSCDIHGVGALLYELLTGESPFQGQDQFETLLHVLEHEPIPPRQLNPDVPRELELICVKCLQQNPQQRYASARDVAVDLVRLP